MNKTAEHDGVVLFPPSQEADFRKRLDALNRKALKFGLDPIQILSMVDSQYQYKKEVLGNGKELLHLEPLPKGAQATHPVILKRAVIKFPIIKLGDWQVIGKLEACGHSNLGFTVTDVEADHKAVREHSDGQLRCEHCNTKRARKEGFLLRGGDASYKLVGTSCLQDFTGIDPAAALFLAQMSHFIRDCDDLMDDYERSVRSNAIGTNLYLANVLFLVKQYGFVSAAKARDECCSATYQDAVSISSSIKSDEELGRTFWEGMDARLAKAQEIRDWVLGREDDSMFFRNLKLLLEQDLIELSPRHLAFAAAAVPAYEREMGAANAKSDRLNEHLGSVGEKLKLSLVLDRIIPFEGRFGVQQMVLMRDPAGRTLVWTSQSCPREIKDAQPGFEFVATFKVKAHEHYKGYAQTKVTHLKMESAEACV